MNPINKTFRQIKMDGHVEEFDAAVEAYEAIDGDGERSRATLLNNCRSIAWFVRSQSSGTVRVFSNACHQRWCPVCSGAKAMYITNTITEWLKQTDHPKLLTLTLKHRSDGLTEQINSLYEAFRKLRSRVVFKRPIFGGIWFFQVHRSKSDGLWHPHLHCLVEGQYLNKSTLSALWQEITHTSKIVDIRAVKNPEEMAKYVARYAARPANLIELSPDSRVEVICALHGRRLCGCWGSAKGVSLKPQKVDDKDEWQAIGNWSTIMNLVGKDSMADTIYRAWLSGEAVPADCTFEDIDRFVQNELSEPCGESPPPDPQKWLNFYN